MRQIIFANRHIGTTHYYTGFCLNRFFHLPDIKLVLLENKSKKQAVIFDTKFKFKECKIFYYQHQIANYEEFKTFESFVLEILKYT